MTVSRRNCLAFDNSAIAPMIDRVTRTPFCRPVPNLTVDHLLYVVGMSEHLRLTLRVNKGAKTR